LDGSTEFYKVNEAGINKQYDYDEEDSDDDEDDDEDELPASRQFSMHS